MTIAVLEILFGWFTVLAHALIFQEPYGAGTSGKKSAGRKRWGVGGTGLGDTLDDWDDFDISMSFSKKPAPQPPVKAKPVNAALHGKKKDDGEDDFFT